MGKKLSLLQIKSYAKKRHSKTAEDGTGAYHAADSFKIIPGKTK